MALDDIQRRAVGDILGHYEAGKRAVLLVAPPGAGKTEMLMGVLGAMPGKRVLFVVHQRELAVQTLERLRARFGHGAVTALMGGYDTDPRALITVAIVHKLVGQVVVDGFDVLVLDEAHHYMAETWRDAISARNTGPLLLGATATPERDDGRPLGDLFEAIVQGGHYSELIANGRLVPAHVVTPKRNLGSDWAMNPVDAWARNGGGKAFFFAPSIKEAEYYAEQWSLRQHIAKCISQNTEDSERAAIMDAFTRGTVEVITCVGTMLEGINVPDCRMVILGRAFVFRGTFLQATGRVLRAHAGKTSGVVVDLTGCTVRHGAPDDDREYSLTGDEAISGPNGNGGATPAANGGGVPTPQIVNVPLHNEYGTPIALPPPSRSWLLSYLKEERKYRHDLKRFGIAIADQKASMRAT